MALNPSTFIGPGFDNPQNGIGGVKAGENSTITNGSLNYNIPANGLLGEPLPVGVTMMFGSASAPTGWVRRGDVNDAAVRIVTTTAGGIIHNTRTFSSTFVANSVTASSGSVTWFGQQTQGTNLNVNTIPQHVHSIVAIDGRNQKVEGGGESQRADPPTGVTSSSTGGGGAHYHSIDNVTGNGAFTANFAVKYYDFIIAQKTQ